MAAARCEDEKLQRRSAESCPAECVSAAGQPGEPGGGVEREAGPRAREEERGGGRRRERTRGSRRRAAAQQEEGVQTP